MGFETQEEAERWAENAEFLADQAKEEKLLSNTPRTDDLLERVRCFPDGAGKVADLSALCRQLERELSAWINDGAHLYCTTCGSCGEEGCCPVGKCWKARHDELAKQ